MNAGEKLTELRRILRGMGGVLVAYSGGVDSTFLAVVSHEELGLNSLAVLACSPVSPPGEREEAELIARNRSFRFQVLASRELDNPDFVSNPPDRCYYCKKELFQDLKQIAQVEKLDWVADGTNADDLSDYRPGRRAGLEAHVRSPLLEAGLTKTEIRQLSREKGLPTWDKPASPCLASRVPYGLPVTPETLEKIAEGEKYLHSLGLHQLRLRHHGDIARIEVDESEMPLVFKDDVRREIVNRLKALGYRFISLDLAGYRSGSLNIGI